MGMILENIILIWAIQALFAHLIHYEIVSRIPRDMADFLLLSFLPYVIYCFLYDKDRLY